MMIGELSIINEWIPEQMEPGTVFVLENAGEVGEREDPYWAVLSCPACGTLGLITRKQMAGLLPTICGSSVCSAQFFIKDEEITAPEPFLFEILDFIAIFPGGDCLQFFCGLVLN